MSLTELAVATVLIGVCLAAVGELAVLNTFASTKLTNRSDGQMGCSRAIKRVCDDVRYGRIIGNAYSFTGSNSYSDTANSDDAISTIAPSGGFPAAPWPSTPYRLSPQTLIVQQPVLYEDAGNKSNPLNGFPLKINPGQLSSGVPAVAAESLDTVIYQLVPETQASGQYELQIARFSGPVSRPECKMKTPINPPQTVLKGIVGPIDPASPGAPSIFQYLRSSQDSSPLKTPTAAEAPEITGISISLEVKVPKGNSTKEAEFATGHAEAFLKNNRFLRLIND